MKTINICEQEYEYSCLKMSYSIRKRIGKIKTMYYWSSKASDYHFIHLQGETGKLSITIYFSNKFLIPNTRTLRYSKRWHITAPQAYNINSLIYEIIFRKNNTKPAIPINTHFGISPKTEKIIRHKYRNKVKRLMRTLAFDVKNGVLTYHTAAIHFSYSTGLCTEASLRYFRQYHTYI